MDEHAWVRDLERRGEGLSCQNCGITEAEMEAANGNLDGCITARVGYRHDRSVPRVGTQEPS